MSVSRFFCETLLSDYHEGLLPPGRRSEIEAKLKESRDCRETYENLQKSIRCLKKLPLRQVPPDVALQVMEICEGRGKTARAGVRKGLWVMLFLLVCASGVLLSIPAVREQLPFSTGSQADNSRFVRYYPLYQGAQEILDEQAAWIQMRDDLAVNFWEEGGFTPSEFERSFQLGSRTIDGADDVSAEIESDVGVDDAAETLEEK